MSDEALDASSIPPSPLPAPSLRAGLSSSAGVAGLLLLSVITFEHDRDMWTWPWFAVVAGFMCAMQPVRKLATYVGITFAAVAFVRPWWALVGITGWARYGLDVALLIAAGAAVGAIVGLVWDFVALEGRTPLPMPRLAFAAVLILVMEAVPAWRDVPVDRQWAEKRIAYERLARMVGGAQLKPDARHVAVVPAWAGLVSADDEIVVNDPAAPGMVMFITDRRCYPGRSSFEAIAFAPGDPLARPDSVRLWLALEYRGRLDRDWYHVSGGSGYRRPPAWVHCGY